MEERKKKNEQRVSWIEEFCSQPENIFFCHVSKAYIRDNFNLYDLKTKFPTESAYKEALSVILDEWSSRKAEDTAFVLDNAKYLYGLIHARYITCGAGLEAMKRKYILGDFGTCPRFGCLDQEVLPIGLTDVVGRDSVKIFCNKCQNVYSCQYTSVDSSFFGPTFPHLFFMTFDALVPEPLQPWNIYVPRIFGFRVHSSSSSLPSSKYYNQSSSGSSVTASESDNDFKIEAIKQHNIPVTQAVDLSASSSPSLLQDKEMKKRKLDEYCEKSHDNPEPKESHIPDSLNNSNDDDSHTQKRTKVTFQEECD